MSPDSSTVRAMVGSPMRAFHAIVTFGALVGVGCQPRAPQAKTLAPASASAASPKARPLLTARRGIETCAEPCADCVPFAASHGRGASRSATAAESELLAPIFHAYLRSPECLADEQRVDADEIGKSVTDVSETKLVVDGAFTAPRRRQTLVTFFMGHCGVMGVHAEHYGKTVLVLLEAGSAIQVSEDGPTDGSYAMPIDIENDGMNELLVESGDYGSGTLFSSTELWSFAGGSTESLAHFDMSFSACFLPDADNFESELLARRDPHNKTLCFLQRRREIHCPPQPAVEDE